jgi:hypothetical protein
VRGDGGRLMTPPPPRPEARSRLGSFHHLVGADEQSARHLEAERIRRIEIDRQAELGRILHRQDR